MKFQRIYKLLLIIGLIMVFLVGCSEQSDNKVTGESKEGESNKPFAAAFSTGSAGGLYNIIGGGMTKVINEKSGYINLNATTPSSVSQVPQMVNDGQAAFGIGMADMMKRAMEGEGEFETAFDNLQPVLAMYDNVMSTIVLKDSPINNVKEIKGKKVGVPSASTQSAVIKIFEEAGIKENDVEWVFLSYNEQAEAIKDGNIDVGVFTAYPKSGLLEELASTKGIKFLQVDQDVRNSFDEKYPLWSTNKIPGGTYPGIDEDNFFYTVYTVLYTNKDVPENVVYDVTKLILENNPEISTIHPAGKDITPEKTKEYIDRKIIDPNLFHPGAKKYFEEKGIIQ